MVRCTPQGQCCSGPLGWSFLIAIMLIGGSLAWTPGTASALYSATTTVSLTVCGDGLVSGVEFCDDGTNTGAYSTSIVARQCNPLCSAYGPYCGDGIIQTLYGEECDDANNTNGDLCDATCQNESPPVTVGGGGGGNPGGGGGKGSGQGGIPGAAQEGNIAFTGETNVVIQGRAYPGATITVLRDGTVERVVEANGTSDFSFTLQEQTPGITTFGFWALDRAGRRSITYSATFQVIQNAVTTLSGLLLPPTLAVTPEKVAPGGSVSFAGSAVQNAVVRAYVDDSEEPEESIAAVSGEYSMTYDTTPLADEQFHTVKAHYVDPGNEELKSGHSQNTNFYVGVNDVKSGIKGDLNGDGLVNLTDFSILLFHWGESGGIADINEDGTVSLPDFSIMLFYWTG